MSTLQTAPLIRAGSASSSRLVDRENDLTPYSTSDIPKSRRNSIDAPPTASPSGLVRPELDLGKLAETHPSPVMVQQIKNDTDYPKHEKADAIVGEQHQSSMYIPPIHYQATPLNVGRITVYSGKSEKAFEFDSATLMGKSSYWRNLLGAPITQDQVQFRAACTFSEPEEFSMALFGKWLYGQKLNGPTDFHSTQHYLGLYVLGRMWGCESLENEVMDLTRNYYATEHMSASPYRLEYIYAYTATSNPMRRFLVSTAAFRALAEGDAEATSADGPIYISPSMQAVLGRDPTLALDLINALVHLHRAELPDARHGEACAWHEHTTTKRCVEHKREVWEQN